ncbi:MAG TPA: hypothetical protein G4O17_02545 [Dehalococcoidia bacterium]|jgi:site-specific DNA recombinase|nr:hypothetical protein [Dehalococcoidia bacterium]
MANFLNQSSLPGRRAFVRSFIEEVRVTGEEVLLTYTIPLTPTGASEDKVGVLPTVYYGGRYWT